MHADRHEVGHILQDSLESHLKEMLADRRPCHYAIHNGGGQVIWVPKHTHCWFEASSGKLIIDTADGSRCEAHRLSYLPPKQALTLKAASLPIMSYQGGAGGVILCAVIQSTAERNGGRL